MMGTWRCLFLVLVVLLLPGCKYPEPVRFVNESDRPVLVDLELAMINSFGGYGGNPRHVFVVEPGETWDSQRSRSQRPKSGEFLQMHGVPIFRARIAHTDDEFVTLGIRSFEAVTVRITWGDDALVFEGFETEAPERAVEISDATGSLWPEFREE
ncbi:MAG: hypothetical protein ACF8SC_00690 [Phycisphaerales bacterium JB037]